MSVPHRNTAAKALTRLILGVFRLHGRLLAAGDELVQPVGLSSARWQVLGAVSLAGQPLSVPAIASDMGLTRQAVQRQVDLLLEGGLVELRPNPAHRRSPLVALTRAGARAYAQADTHQARWVNELAERFSRQELATADEVIARLNAALDPESKESTP